jgi:hypothetical protein
MAKKKKAVAKKKAVSKKKRALKRTVEPRYSPKPARSKKRMLIEGETAPSPSGGNVPQTPSPGS